MTPTEQRRKLRNAGFDPLPVSGKAPVLERWQMRTETSAGDIEIWDRLYPFADGTGCLTRLMPTLDVDIMDPDAAAAVEALAHGRYVEHGLILSRFGRPPKRAIPFRTDVPFKKYKVDVIGPDGREHKIEFLGDGQQVVVAGTHPETKRPYSWHGRDLWDVRREDLPPITEEEAHALVDDATELLIAEHRYRIKDKPKPNGPDRSSGDHNEWPDSISLVDHDALTAFAMKLLLAGMQDGAVVNMLRAIVGGLQGVDRERKQRRLHEIRGIVSSARTKIGEDKHQSAAQSDMDEWNAGTDPGPIPPREWLLGNQFCRGFISSIVAAGGSGKSALRLVQFVSLATGRPLCGQHVFKRCRILLISLEDDRDELQRRITAILKNYGISRSEVDGWLWCACPKRAKLAVLNGKNRVYGPLTQQIRDAIERRKPDIVSLDPFIKTHGLDENLSGDMDFVCDLLAEMAVEYGVAVDSPHHVRKGAVTPGDADAGRGSTGIRDAGRLVYTLVSMSEDEAKAFSISVEDRLQYVRLDSAKINIAARSGRADWFRLVGVPLDNGTAEYPNGDMVQVVEPWSPPETWSGLSSIQLNAALTEIDAGMPNGQRFSDHNTAKERSAWRVIQKHCPDRSEAQCREIIRTWVRNGVLYSEPYDDPVRRERVVGLRLNNAKRPS